jgi:uncharacterized membrane protein (DUF4010 family)
LATSYGGWVIAAGVLATAGLLVVANLMKMKNGEADPGLTTEIAALLLFGIGAGVVIGQMAVSVALGGVIALLLHSKKPMHAFVARIGESDIKAIMQFVLVALVIWPLLPNRDFGPYAVLNPYKIWLMVVFIVGLNVAGYVAFKIWGTKAGVILAGLLGGLVSSTATTVAYSRRAAASSNTARLAALVIMIASTTVFLRLLVEIGTVAPATFLQVAPPIGVMLVACAVISLATLRFNHETNTANAGT